MPCLKLNDVDRVSKHCGSIKRVAEEALQERKGRDSDIDLSKTAKNITLGFQSAAALIAYSEHHIAKLNEKLRADGQRGIRKDAVKMCVLIIKPPADWIKSMIYDQQIQFFMDALEKFEDIVGKDNIKSVAIHFDEQAPHMHIFWEPMTPDGRLCAKEMHGLRYFRMLNREMPKHLRSKGWEIDDCRVYDAAEEQELKAKLGKEGYRQHLADKRAKNGRSSFKYKAEMEAENEELVRSTTVSPEKKTKGVFGKEKVIEKTDQEIENERLILAAQAVLRDKEQAEHYKEYYQKLKDKEDQMIEEMAKEIANRTITKNELEAIRTTRKYKSKIDMIEKAIYERFGISLTDLFGETQIDESGIIEKEISGREINYERE